MSSQQTDERASSDTHPHDGFDAGAVALPILSLRAAVGGVLMGLANLVPGISGGTMLLAAGVYPAFIRAIAELSTLRLHFRSIYLVGAIAGSAALAILLLAGAMKSLVVEQRWVMYSLFIGLTLGGVPLVWRMTRPATPSVWAGAAGAFVFMIGMQLGLGGGDGGGASTPLLLLSGLAGAAAMILPGVSGGYLLLLLGQYEHILGAIDMLKQGLIGDGGFDPGLLMESMKVVVPVGLGVVAGVVGVSNLLRWLLDRYEKATLGVLLGLLFGAVVGLWPFQQPVPPQAGDVVDGRTLSAEQARDLDSEDWRLELFTPRAGQLAGALALLGAGLATTWLIDRVGGEDPDEA
ncbi:MAG: undecaprenyl phosphate translocase family protein [Myxococcota bacterium]